MGGLVEQSAGVGTGVLIDRAWHWELRSIVPVQRFVTSAKSWSIERADDRCCRAGRLELAFHAALELCGVAALRGKRTAR